MGVVMRFDLPVNREENAVSALLRLEAESKAICNYWMMDVPCNTDRAWFFALKLVYELKRVDPARRCGRRGRRADANALRYAKQARNCLRGIRRNTPDQPHTVDLYVSFKYFLDKTRLEMEQLIDAYPGSTEPVVQEVLLCAKPA